MNPPTWTVGVFTRLTYDLAAGTFQPTVTGWPWPMPPTKRSISLQG